MKNIKYSFGLALIISFFVEYGFAQRAIPVSPSEIENYSQAQIYFQKGFKVLDSVPDQCIRYSKQIIDYLEAPQEKRTGESFQRLKVDSYNLMGQAYLVLEEPRKAVHCFRQAVNLGRDIQYEDGLDKASKQLAILRARREEKNQKLSRLARWGHHIEAEMGKWIAQKPVEVLGQELELLAIQQAAAIEEQHSNYEKALRHRERLLEIYQEENDSIRVAETRHKMAWIYHKQGNMEKAFEFIHSFLDEELGVSEAVDTSYEVGVLAMSEAQKSAKDIDQWKATADESERKGKWQEALAARKKYAELKEQIKDAELRKGMDSLTLTHKLREQAAKVELLKQKNAYRTEKLQREKWSLVAGIGLLTLVILFLSGLFLYRNRSHKRLSKAYNELGQAHQKLKTAQTKLVESEKLASLGQLTAGIAHEINNPVNFISGNISPLKRDLKDVLAVLQAYEETIAAKQLQDKFGEVDELKEDLEIEFVAQEIDQLISGIDEGASRTAEIVKGLRTFARMDEEVKKPFDIHKGLDATLTLLNHQCKGLEIVKDYRNLMMIEAFPGKINQVFMNILTNAIHALNGKGKIVIKSSVMEQPKVKNMLSQRANQQYLSSAQYLLISIRDNGEGIPEEIKERIFDPFFTTKDVGKGTGLGLSISKSIIEDHQGIIEINSEKGIGTEVQVFLPFEKQRAATIA